MPLATDIFRLFDIYGDTAIKIASGLTLSMFSLKIFILDASAVSTLLIMTTSAILRLVSPGDNTVHGLA